MIFRKLLVAHLERGSLGNPILGERRAPAPLFRNCNQITFALGKID